MGDGSKIHVVLLGVDSEVPHDVTFDPLKMYFLRNFLEKEVTAVTGLTTTLTVDIDEPLPQYSHPTDFMVTTPAKVRRTPPEPVLMVGKCNATLTKAVIQFALVNRVPFHVLIIESDESSKEVHSAMVFTRAMLDNPVRDLDGTLSVPLRGQYDYGITVDLLARECLKTLSM